MNRIHIPAAAALCLFVCVCNHSAAQTGDCHGTGPDTSPEETTDRILGSDDFRGTSVSILAMTGAGDTLLCRDCDRLLIPASNMKLVTTALALHSLGPDYRYETRLGYSGRIEDGTLLGDLYIIGGGDPTLGSDNGIAIPLDTLFREWEAIVHQAGIRRIQGHVVGDGRFFSGMDEHPTWELCDAGTYYGTGASGLSFHENTIDMTVSAGEHPGAPVNIRQEYPETPWMTFIYSCRTGKPGTGNTMYFYPDDFSPAGEMRGTYAMDRRPGTESVANKFPEYTLAWYFCRYLSERGIESGKGPADINPVLAGAYGSATRPDNGCRPGNGGTGKPEIGGGFPNDVERRGYTGDTAGDAIIHLHGVPDDSLTVIGSTLSPALTRIAEVTCKESNNLYAETLMKTLGKEYCGSGCYDSAYVAISGLLDEIGAGSRRILIKDGSGLSRENLLSAEFLCGFLEKMMSSPSFGEFFDSLPFPGGSGTLEFNMRSVPEAIRTRIRMKSGSMGGVRCFSGYIVPETGTKDETVIFSILVNGYTVPLSRIQKGIDNIILSLTGWETTEIHKP